MLACVFRKMMKFVKKKSTAATSPQQAVEISRPSNLIVSKHKLVRTDGDFILIMQDDKVIGLLDRRDLDLNVVAVPQHAPPPPPASSVSPSSPQSHQYLAPSSSNRSAELEPPVPQSPVGVSPSAYRSLPPGFSAKHHQQQQNPALYQFQLPQNGSASQDQNSAYKWTSVEHLFSPPIPTNTRTRSETTLQPQGSHKYDTITFAPGVQLPGSSSAHCNVEIRLGDERTPPPPTRAPPAPLTMSPCHCTVVLPEEKLQVLDYTEVLTMSVEDPEIAAMSLDDMRKHAEDFECFIQEQVQQKWSQEKAETERWIKNIAGKVAKTETINTIRGEMGRKKRPSLTEVFSAPLKSPALDPTDPVPNYEYEKLYVSEVPKSPLKRQGTQESDGDIEDIRF